MTQAADLPVVLVADDSPDDLHFFQRLVQKAALQNPVVTVSDGAQAIAYLRGSCPGACSPRRHPPAVVFLDVHMPLVDGFEVLNWIRRGQRCFKTTVVMLTDSADPHDMSRAAELGANGYLLKHPNPLVLASVVHQAACPILECPPAIIRAADDFPPVVGSLS